MTRDTDSSTVLGASTLGYLRRSGEEVEFAEGERIIRRGELAEALFVVLSGEVELRIKDQQERALPLCRIGPGSIFGELSVLRDAPASADVYALTDTTALRYPAEAVPEALVEWQPLRRKLLNRLADQLTATREEAWRLFQRAETLESLVTSDGTSESLVLASPLMKTVARRVEEAAPGGDPALIIGEPGCGRMTLARRMHELSDRAEESLLVVDCKRLAEGEAAALLFGSAAAHQSSMMSGVGAVQLARGGTLILRNLESLELRAQLQLARHVQRDRRGGVEGPEAKIIATAGEIDRQPSADLSSELSAAFPATIRVPPLVERPRDIVPLARHFLQACADPDDRMELNASAERALVSLVFRHRNAAELRDVVELAARCTDGAEVSSEHIFGGISREEDPGIALTDSLPVGWLVRRGGVRLIQAITAAGFFAVILICFAWPATAVARLANGFVWSVWEPVVFALFLLAGAVWCTVCPLSSSGRLAQRLFSLGRPPPAWLRGLGPWLAASGFFVILYVQVVFDMTARPRGTALLLTSLVAASVILCLLYRREVWCRHLCPLGQLGVALAPAAPLTVAAPRSVCQSTCTSYACYRGTVAVPGCTVFHHPQIGDHSHRCKLCLDCLQTCPHGAANLYLRPPLRAAWSLDEPPPSLAHFMVPVSLFCLLFLALDGSTIDPWRLAAAGAGTLALGWLLSWKLPSILGGMHTPDDGASQRVSAAMLVLGWGPLMAVEFGNVPWFETHRIIDTTLGPVAGSDLAGVSMLAIARIGAIAAAAAAAALILWRAQRRPGPALRRTAGWLVVWSLGLAYFLAAVLMCVSK